MEAMRNSRKAVDANARRKSSGVALRRNRAHGRHAAPFSANWSNSGAPTILMMDNGPDFHTKSWRDALHSLDWRGRG